MSAVPQPTAIVSSPTIPQIVLPPISQGVPQFIPPIPKPDFTKEVLKPLYAAEAENARQAALAAALAAQQALQQQQAAEAAAKAAQAAIIVSTPRPVAQVSGSCEQWLQEAGVTDIADAMLLINRESGCNPHAVNRSSGACGIPQDVRGCEVGYDPVAQIQWLIRYVDSRYGGFAGAWQHEVSQHWY